jgi:hypothetical protein
VAGVNVVTCGFGALQIKYQMLMCGVRHYPSSDVRLEPARMLSCLTIGWPRASRESWTSAKAIGPKGRPGAVDILHLHAKLLPSALKGK